MRLADDDVRVVNANPESKYAMGIDIRDYELESQLERPALRRCLRHRLEDRRAQVGRSKRRTT